MTEKAPSKAEILLAVQAQSETLDSLSKRILKVEQRNEKQEARNNNIIIAVIVAAFLIIVTVASEVIISDKIDQTRADNLLERVHEVEIKQGETIIKQTEIEKDLNLIKERNPYLK